MKPDPFKYDPIDGLERFMPSSDEMDQLLIGGEFILAWETMFPTCKLNDHENLRR